MAGRSLASSVGRTNTPEPSPRLLAKVSYYSRTSVRLGNPGESPTLATAVFVSALPSTPPGGVWGGWANCTFSQAFAGSLRPLNRASAPPTLSIYVWHSFLPVISNSERMGLEPTFSLVECVQVHVLVSSLAMHRYPWHLAWHLGSCAAMHIRNVLTQILVVVAVVAVAIFPAGHGRCIGCRP